MLYLAGVVLSAVFLGRGPAILTAFLGVLAFDFFLVPPYLTFAVTDAQYFLTFAGLFVVGLVVGTLAARAREQARSARSRELQTGDLYELSRALASAPTVDDVVNVAVDHVRSSWGGAAVVLLGEDEELVVTRTDPGVRRQRTRRRDLGLPATPTGRPGHRHSPRRGFPLPAPR